MNKPKPNNGHQGELFMALSVLIGVPLVFTLLLMGEAKREYLHTFLFEVNRGAFFTTIATVGGYLAALSILFKKKANVLTDDLKDAFASFKKAKEIELPKSMLFAPYILSTFVLCFSFLVSQVFGVTRWYWLDILKNEEFSSLRSILTTTTSIAPYPLIVFFSVVFLNSTGLAKRWRKHLLEKKERQALQLGLLPELPQRSNQTGPSFILGAREAKSSLKFEPNVSLPSWVEYRAPETYGGMAIFGMKGSGKSQLILRMIDQTLSHKVTDLDRKLSLCVIDVKGDLTAFIKKKAAEVGRSHDVIHLGVETTSHWNPIGHLDAKARFSDCRQVGYFLRSAMSVGGGQSGGDNNKYWEDNADNLCARTIHLLALANEQVNFSNIYSTITHMSSSDEGSVEYRQRLYEAAQANVSANRVLSDELKETREYFENEFVKLDTRVRTIVINVASNFLQKFMTNEYKASFGRNVTDANHFYGFRELIARGGILILDIRSNEHGTIANALATLCKLSYMAAVKTRDRYAPDKNIRKTVLVLDEYQGYPTPSSTQTEGDDKYFETSRSFGAIDVIATQQRASLVAAVGDHMASRILGNFNTLITFKHNDPSLTDYLSKLSGTEEVYTDTISIQEGSSSAKGLALQPEEHSENDHNVSRSVSFSKKEKSLIDANLFKSLTQFEAIGMFDGFGERRVVRFYVKPVFADVRAPHASVMNKIAESYENET